MPRYVDAFVFAVSADRLDVYARHARRVAKLWLEHGALAYREAARDEGVVEAAQPFDRAVRRKVDEALVFGWIDFRSRAHRDRVNARVARDPRMAALTFELTNLVDFKRMSLLGFDMLVDQRAGNAPAGEVRGDEPARPARRRGPRIRRDAAGSSP